MRDKYKIYQETVFFTRWSRKGYAVMASLGSYIQISRLSVDICKQTMLKLIGFLFLAFSQLSLDSTEEDEECLLAEIVAESELVFYSSLDSDNFDIVYNYIIDIKAYVLPCGRM